MKLLASRRRSFIVLLLLSSLLFAAPRPGSAQSYPLPTDGMLLWLDAGDPDADGNPNNNPADSAEVTTWKDKSGNGNHANPYVTSDGGTYQRNEVNGLPVVRFDTAANTQGYVTDFSLQAAETPQATVLTVYRILTDTMDMIGAWGNYERAFYPVDNGTTTGFVGIGGGILPTPETGSTGRFHLFTVAYNGNVVGGVNSGPADGSAAYLNGDLISTFTDTTDDSVSDPGFAIGLDGLSSELMFDGDIAELIIFERVLSDAELQTIFWQLGQKYAEDFGGTPPPQEEPSGPQCFTDVDMAVSPQFITLAPGGEATVNVALRNTNDELQGYNDLLVSFSDGLDVVSVSDGGVDLDRRAAWQKFQLEANETREFAVTVRAAEQLTAAPLHITELYCGGRVLERIDGVFITPAPTAAPAVVAVEPAPTAAPAPLPAVLPNTVGQSGTLDPSLAIWPLLIVLTAWLLQLRRRA